MASIGVIGYANASGIGNLICSLKEMLPEMSQLIVDHPIKDKVRYWLPHKHDCRVTLKNPSVKALRMWVRKAKLRAVLLIEYPYNWAFLPELRRLGVKIVMMPLLDCFPLRAYQHIHMIDAWVAPTDVAYSYLKKRFDNVYRLNSPINTIRFAYKERGKASGVFLHNGGYLGGALRKQTPAVLKAFGALWKAKKVKKLILNLQIPFKGATNGAGVQVRVKNVATPEQLYIEGDVYIYPSTAEGIGLQILEAMSCGFPVVTTDYPPMNQYVHDKNLLVKATPPSKKHYLHGRPKIDFQSLVRRMQYAGATDLSAVSRRNRKHIEKLFSYDALRPQYRKVFSRIIKG